MLFKRIDITSTPRGNFVSSVCPIQTIQRAKTRRIKTRTRTKTSSTRRRKTQRDRERERERERERIKQTRSNTTTYHFIRLSEGKILGFFLMYVGGKRKKTLVFHFTRKTIAFHRSLLFCDIITRVREEKEERRRRGGEVFCAASGVRTRAQKRRMGERASL